MARFWRYLKFGAFGCAGLLGLGLIWLAVANAQANGKLQERLDALKAAGEPTTLADLARKPIPPETNAETYLNRAQDDIMAIQKAMSADFEKDDENAFYHGKPGGQAYQTARQALADHPMAIPLLIQAANCADYDPQLNFQLVPSAFLEQEYLPNTRNKRAAMRALNYQALVDLGEGRPDAAIEKCLTMLRLARLYESDPLLINHLVVLAVRGVAMQATGLVLRSGPLKPEAYDALETELTKVDPAKTFRHVLRTDRAYGIDSFRELSESGYLMLPSGKNDEGSYLDLFALLIADGPRTKPSEAAEKIFIESGPLTRLMAPAIRAVYDTNTRALAQIRALRVLNALYRSGQTGDKPDLNVLKLPDEVLVDPYNQQPLIIKRQDKGWLVYSVGKNGKDDGGSVEEHDDVGFGPQ